MRRCTAKARHEFIETLLTHIPEMVPNGKTSWSWFTDGKPFAEKLMRYGATLGRLAEEQCNGYQDYKGNWDEKATERSEKKEARIRIKVTELCKPFGCTPVFQGDPRGNVLKIRLPNTHRCGYVGPCDTCPKCVEPTEKGYTNDWGKEGICVPTS